MGGPFRRIFALTAALACAALLAACGGGGDDSTTTSSTASGAEGGVAGTGGAGANADEGGAAQSGNEGSEGSSAAGEGSGSEGSSGDRADLDLPKRGKVSAQSKSFEKYSAPGKLHLAEFGHEAEGEDRGEAEEVLVGYLQAAGGEEWDKACGYLMAAIKAELGHLYANSDPPPKSCPEQLALTAKSELWRKASDGSPIYAPEGIASFRIKEGGLARGGAGFALFHGSDGEDHWLAMKVEGGQWKVLSTSPQPFK
jgi:hypothetical protein